MFEATVIVLDRSGRIVLVTPPAARLCAAGDANELLGHSIDEFVALDARDAVMAVVVRACDGGVSTVEYSLEFPGSHAQIVAMSTQAIVSEGVGSLCLGELRVINAGHRESIGPQGNGVGGGEIERMARVHTAVCDTYEAEIAELQIERTELAARVGKLEGEHRRLLGQSEAVVHTRRAHQHWKEVVSEAHNNLDTAIKHARAVLDSR